MENNQPLVSVGIPTYNRPDGLRKTLDCITGQTYRNLEIIISDNCSLSAETEKVAREFIEKDSRVQFFRQPENKVAVYNFKFVLEKTAGDYFMWAADDDMWQGQDMLKKLMNYAPDNVLTYPEAVVKDINGELEYLLKDYGFCQTRFDYLKTFCSVGWGYPFYGIYNLNKFKDNKLEFEFDTDLMYYSEGIFLHKIFMTGYVKYVKEAQILFSPNGSQPSIDTRIDNFTKYFKRLLDLYVNSSLPDNEKSELVKLILKTNNAYCKALFESLVPKDLLQKYLSNNDSEKMNNSRGVANKITNKINSVANKLFKSNYNKK